MSPRARNQRIELLQADVREEALRLLACTFHFRGSRKAASDVCGSDDSTPLLIEYHRFIVLKSLSILYFPPRYCVTPSPVIRRVWAQHVLDTRHYRDDMDHLAVGPIHYDQGDYLQSDERRMRRIYSVVLGKRASSGNHWKRFWGVERSTNDEEEPQDIREEDILSEMKVPCPDDDALVAQPKSEPVSPTPSARAVAQIAVPTRQSNAPQDEGPHRRGAELLLNSNPTYLTDSCHRPCSSSQILPRTRVSGASIASVLARAGKRRPQATTVASPERMPKRQRGRSISSSRAASEVGTRTTGHWVSHPGFASQPTGNEPEPDLPGERLGGLARESTAEDRRHRSEDRDGHIGLENGDHQGKVPVFSGPDAPCANHANHSRKLEDGERVRLTVIWVPKGNSHATRQLEVCVRARNRLVHIRDKLARMFGWEAACGFAFRHGPEALDMSKTIADYEIAEGCVLTLIGT